MDWLKRFLDSTVGMKFLMALTGLLLFGFVLQHMIGNFIVYTGADNFNAYAAGLKSLGNLLWVARGGLLAIFLVHIMTAFRLTQLNKAARPIAYQNKKAIDASFASRTMVMSGVIILLFLLYHLAHFTLHWVGDVAPPMTDEGIPDVYQMFVLGFQDPVASLLYVFANLFLGLHLSHGLSSLFQTLGLRTRKYRLMIHQLAMLLGWGVALGNISFPVAVLLGVITL